jgi:4-oxalomesaconate hydratase
MTGARGVKECRDLSETQKTGLVVTAHPGDFVWRAGGAIALHARRGYRVKIVCLSMGERGESQFAWREGARLEDVKAQRRDEADRAAELLGAEIEHFDAGDYPLVVTPEMLDRLVDVYRALKPSFVLTHALKDPYNFDHPVAAHLAQEARVVAQAKGHKPDPNLKYQAPPVFLFEPHQPEQCDYRPDLFLKIDEVWDVKARTFEILAAQRHLWDYYTRVALNRGIQGSRNSGVPMVYGEAYQRLFPTVVEELQ